MTPRERELLRREKQLEENEEKFFEMQYR